MGNKICCAAPREGKEKMSLIGVEEWKGRYISLLFHVSAEEIWKTRTTNRLRTCVSCAFLFLARLYSSYFYCLVSGYFGALHMYTGKAELKDFALLVYDGIAHF